MKKFSESKLQELSEKIQSLDELSSDLKSNMNSINTSSIGNVGEIGKRMEEMNAEVTNLKQLISITEKRISELIGDKITHLKENSEQGINDLHQQIQLVNTRVTTSVQSLESYNRNIEQLKTDFNTKLSTLKPQSASQDINAQMEKSLTSVRVEVTKSMDHLKQSMDALWNSIGVLSGRIVDVEANVDRLK